jgi:hypothetical protein
MMLDLTPECIQNLPELLQSIAVFETYTQTRLATIATHTGIENIWFERVELRNIILDELCTVLKKFQCINQETLISVPHNDAQHQMADSVLSDRSFTNLVRTWSTLHDQTPTRPIVNLPNGRIFQHTFANAEFAKFHAPLEHGKAGEVQSYVINALNKSRNHFRT